MKAEMKDPLFLNVLKTECLEKEEEEEDLKSFQNIDKLDVDGTSG